MESNSDYNPRYLKYCQAHDLLPSQMLEHDMARYPGGCMTGYISWIQAKWSEWRRAMNFYGPAGKEDHAAFDLWL